MLFEINDLFFDKSTGADFEKSNGDSSEITISCFGGMEC